MVVFIGAGLPLTFKRSVPINAATSANPFSYGAEAGDLAIIVGVGDQAFNAVGAAQPAPAGWTQPTYLIGGVTGFGGGGGEVNFLYKRLTAADNIAINILGAVSGGLYAWMLLYSGGRRPPPAHYGTGSIGLFVGAVPNLPVASVSSRPPAIVVMGGISDGGAGNNTGGPPSMIRETIALSQSTGWVQYCLIPETALPNSYTGTCPGGTNFAGHAGFYIEA